LIEVLIFGTFPIYRGSCCIINHFQIKDTLDGNGKENEACFIFKQDDFKIVKIAEVYE
jgi:hypothetical protein